MQEKYWRWELKFIFVFSPQFGNKVGKGQFRGKPLPTYIYTKCVKAAARALVGENLRDYPDPATTAVSVYALLESFYSGTRLIRTPRGHEKVSVLSGCPY